MKIIWDMIFEIWQCLISLKAENYIWEKIKISLEHWLRRKQNYIIKMNYKMLMNGSNYGWLKN